MIQIDYSSYKEAYEFINSRTYKGNESNTYKNQICFFNSYLKQGMVAIDAGACRGIFTVLFNKLVYPNGKVFAFEPEEKNFNDLIKAVTIDNNCVTCINSALSDYCGRGTLYIYDDGRPEWHYMVESDKDNINVTYIDKFCRDNKITKVDLLKIDVEGQDLKVLNGAEYIIDNNENIAIVMEVHHGDRFAEQKEDVFEFFISKKFRLYSLENNFEEIVDCNYTIAPDIVAMRKYE